jgi:hypothetical protein
MAGRRIPKRMAQHVAVAFLAVLVGMGVSGEHQLLGVAVLGVLAGALCLLDPYLGATALIVSAFTLEWVVFAGLAPSSAKLAQDVLAVALLAGILLTGRRSEASPLRLVGVRLFVAFSAFAVVGWVLNETDVAAAWVGFRNLWLFGPLALAPAAFRWTERQCRLIVGLLVGLAVLQAPVAAVQFALSPRGVSGDPIGGTLGGSTSGVLTALLIGMMTLVIGMYLYRVGSQRRLLVFAALLALPPALNETKVFFVAAPFAWGVLLLPRMRRYSGSVAVSVALGALVVYGAFYSYSSLYGSRYTGQNAVVRLTQEELGAGTSEGGVMKRLPSVAFATAEIAREPTTLLFGHGGGSLARSAALGTSGTLIQLYGELLRNTVSAAALPLEYGLCGLSAFLALVMVMLVHGRRLERVAGQPFWKATGFGLQGFGLTLLLLSVYTDTFAAGPLACVFWSLSGVTVAQLGRRALAVSPQVEFD